MARFWHVSLLIDLDYEWWWPTPAVFTDTANYFPRRARALVHESIHYWQQLSHGYLLLLAQEDWRQLLEWEQGGRPALGPVREHHRQPEGLLHFSTHDLSECMARFWELLFVGVQVVLRDAVAEARRKSLSGVVPEELKQLANQEKPDSRAFDMAMNLSGSYGAPFAVVRNLLGSAAALAVFPFLVHFALKTMRPVHFFERFLREVAPALAEKADALGITTSTTENLWELYPFASECCERVVRQAGQGGLLHSLARFPDTGLADNPAYMWSFRRVESLAAAKGMATIDEAICLPAFSNFRVLLGGYLTPPCVRFRDRQTLALSELFAASHGDESSDEVAAAQAAMAAVLSVQERWETFQDVLRRH